MSKEGKPVPDYVYKTPQRVSVEVKKAQNGYVLCSYGDKGETLVVAKDKKEMKEHMHRMMNKTKI